MAARDRKSAITLTVMASLIWGTSFPGTKVGLDYAGNDVIFLWLRFAVAVGITLPVVLYLRKMPLSIFKHPLIWLIGGSNAAGFVLQYVGLTITTASKTALLVDINVVGVAILSYFMFKERLGRMQTAGIVCGTIGVFFLTLNKDLVFDEGQLIGDIMVYLAGWSWAFFIVFNKQMLGKYNGVEISSAAVATCAAWLTLPAAYVALNGADLAVETTGWAFVVYLGLFCTSIAILLWALGLEGVSATASATIMLVEVLTALLISIFWLHETMSAAAIFGSLLVLSAIYLVAGTGTGEKEPVKSA
ncbi:MAG: DMT family transporter [Thermoplasmata archaeon]|jgi:drug/metabolite transporter (DMT)-like permease|nr:DMT family transporter [Thermoplasmata archaeon]